MEDSSQQTDLSHPHLPCYVKYCSEFGLLLAFLIFVLLALSVAFIFNYRHKDRPSPTLTPNDTKSSRGFVPSLNNKTKLYRSSIHKFPFLGALFSRNPDLFLCPIVIIEPNYVLTRATCFVSNFQDLMVRVGSSFWNKSGDVYEVDFFKIKDNFTYLNLENNIALVYLKRNITLNENVKLANTSHLVSEKRKGIAVGWLAESTAIGMVQQAVFIWNHKKCAEYFHTKNVICANILNSSNLLYDVTGPLVQNGELIGFWSWGFSCLGQPSAFTNLIHHANWIYGGNNSFP